jgi:hypothetical protein
MLHEQQYQESPPFIFLPKRPKLTYSSAVVQYYYAVQETQLWARQRVPKYWISTIARKLGTWCMFYCGYLLSTPLVIPGILRGGRIRWMQIALIVILATLAIQSGATEYTIRGLIDIAALAQIVLLWFVFNNFWPRLAIATCTLLLLEGSFVKWSFPHYFAPAACLVLYLQVEGLRRIWEWNPQVQVLAAAQTRHEHRRLARENRAELSSVPRVRGFVYLLPIACLFSLALRVEARIQGWKEDIHGPDRQALLMHDWSLRRAELEKWLEQQPTPQLVFVQYAPWHNVNFEWVYNHADIMHSQVIWARDLGTEHNKLLLKLVPERSVWLLQPDVPEPQLVSYSEVDSTAPVPIPASQKPAVAASEQEQLDW